MSVQPAVENGSTYLLFLTRTGAGSYTFTDRFIGAVRFSSLPQQTGPLGLEKLESALTTVAQGPRRDESIKALQLLQGLPTVREETLSVMRRLQYLSDPEAAFGAAAVALKTGTPDSVADLRHLVDTDSGIEPTSLTKISVELDQVSDGRARPDVEALTSSKFMLIRLGAVGALRRMKNRSSAPKLIERLDDPNTDVQYLAVITLAEIFGKYDGDYAPSNYLFDKRPGFYTALWKNWWSQQAH
jgi:hypothetical protein